MLYRPELWPTEREVIAARWFENTRMDDVPGCWLLCWEPNTVKERRSTNDQTCTLASDEPDRIKFDDGSTAREVTGFRCKFVLVTVRPVHV